MQRLQSVAVSCVTVTPLFMAGAEQGRPEIRASSIRGALRYWLRAALGGLLGGDVQAVQRAEARVFGAPGADEGGSQSNPIPRGVSAVSIIMPPVFAPSREYAKSRAVSVVKDGRRLVQPTGRDYLYWSMSGIGGPARRYVVPDSTFKFTMSTYPGRFASEPPGAPAGGALAAAMGALWLLTRLGGIGSRSRRAAGNLAVTSPDAWGGLPFKSRATNVAGAAEELASGIRAVQDLLARSLELRRASLSGRAQFDVLAPGACRIWVLGVWPTWEEAVEAMGAALRDFRTYLEPDHTNVRRWGEGGSIPTVERAAFGLPLLFRYGSGPKVSIEGRLRGKPSTAVHRRASPLWLSVWKLEKGHAGMATLYQSAFLPDGAVLANALRPGSTTAVPSDYRLIVRFIEERFPDRKEVRLV